MLGEMDSDISVSLDLFYPSEYITVYMLHSGQMKRWRLIIIVVLVQYVIIDKLVAVSFYLGRLELVS